jgi:hypothetical protein
MTRFLPFFLLAVAAVAQTRHIEVIAHWIAWWCIAVPHRAREILALKPQADRLGAADNEAAWRDAIARGAEGIQTDHPTELIQFLKSLEKP